jgi:hypothetical protein
MTVLGLADVLTLVQTIAIIVALLVTLYFSRRQIQALSRDLEARVLNDLNEHLLHLGEIALTRPDTLSLIAPEAHHPRPQAPFAYSILFFFAHIFHMRRRGILQNNEWTGWHEWMRTAFVSGELGNEWRNSNMRSYVDPDFRAFVDTDLLGDVTRVEKPADLRAPPP